MNPNLKEKIGIGVSIFTCVLFLGIFFLTSSIKEESPPVQQPVSQKEIVKTNQPELPTPPKENKTIEFRKSGIATTLGIENIKYTTNLTAESTVYDLMKQIEIEGKIKFKEKTYAGLGKFIDELNGVRGNSDKFWIYYVNGVKAKVGVSNYKIKPGDTVYWKYEKDI